MSWSGYAGELQAPPGGAGSKQFKRGLTLCCLALGLLGETALGATIITFDVPGSTSTTAEAINDSGAITGTYVDANGQHGFVRFPLGTFLSFDVPGSTRTTAASINAAGSITGIYFDANGQQHGFVRDPSGVITMIVDPLFTDTEPGFGVTPTSINTAGAIAGFYNDVRMVANGFVRDPSGVLISFDLLGNAEVSSINDSGAITGFYKDVSNLAHGFLRDPIGNLISFDPPGGDDTFPSSINAAGAITGSTIVVGVVLGGGGQPGFVRDSSGNFTTFFPPGSSGTQPTSINAAGTITGNYFAAVVVSPTVTDVISHGFVRDPSGNITVFDPVAIGNTVPSSINGAGTITGTYFDTTRITIPGTFPPVTIPRQHGFVYIPSSTDALAPTAAPTQFPAANGAGWNSTDVTVTWNWTDNAGGSGIDTANCTFISISSGEGTLPLGATCKDLAGNTGTATRTVKVDKTPPTITASAKKADNTAYAVGTWTNQTVTVSFTCSDSGSGVATCPANQIFSADGKTTTASGTTFDVAGNSASAGFGPVWVDKTPPVLNPIVSPNPVLLNGAATATSGAADALSGLASQSCGAVTTSSVGTKSVTCTATDNAGNTNSAAVNYTVDYTFSGFLAPVKNPPSINMDKANDKITLAWQLSDGKNAFISALTAVTSITYKGTSCTAFTNDPAGALQALADNGKMLRFNSAAKQYDFDWATPSAGCYTLFLKLNSGQTFDAWFNLKK
jgi:hypothetical protein